MESIFGEDELESSSGAIFKLPGEPAVVINGMPTAAPKNGDPDPAMVDNDDHAHTNPGFGDWLEGREVRKLFGGQFYSGKVAEFDNETGWYRVIYEDGDFEDLEWRELEEVLLPLDITVPLKSLAMKIIARKQKLLQKPGGIVPPSTNRTKSRKGKGRLKPSGKNDSKTLG